MFPKMLFTYFPNGRWLRPGGKGLVYLVNVEENDPWFDKIFGPENKFDVTSVSCELRILCPIWLNYRVGLVVSFWYGIRFW